jgi:hypothetical protein
MDKVVKGRKEKGKRLRRKEENKNNKKEKRKEGKTRKEKKKREEMGIMDISLLHSQEKLFVKRFPKTDSTSPFHTPPTHTENSLHQHRHNWNYANHTLKCSVSLLHSSFLPLASTFFFLASSILCYHQ